MKCECTYCKSKEFSYYEIKYSKDDLLDVLQCDKFSLFFALVYEYKKTITIPDGSYRFNEKGGLNE